MFAGWSRRSSRTSPLNDVDPSVCPFPCRPSFHTRKSVDPGAHSHRNTTFDCTSRKANPPGFAATDGLAYGANRAA